MSVCDSIDPCSFYANLRSERMGCCCKGLPKISVRNIFRRIRCISACCGGKIVFKHRISMQEKYLRELYYNPESQQVSVA